MRRAAKTRMLYAGTLAVVCAAGLLTVAVGAGSQPAGRDGQPGAETGNAVDALFATRAAGDAATSSGPTADDRLLAQLVARGGVIRLDNRSYALSRPLNLRDVQYVDLQGGGPNTLIVSVFGRGGETWPIIDMVGASDCRIAHLRVRPAGDVVPACGILLGRSSAKSAANHTFDRVIVDGKFSTACVVNVGSELAVWMNSKLMNAAPGGHNYVTGSWWPREWRARVRSPHGPLWAGEKWGGADRAPDGVHTFIAGCLGVYGHTGQECNVWLLPGAHLATFTGTYFSNKAKDRNDRSSGGLAAVRVGTPEAPRECFHHDGLSFTNCYFETPGARHAFLVHARSSIQISGGVLLAQENCLQEQGYVVQVDWNLTGVDAKCGCAGYDWGP